MKNNISPMTTLYLLVSVDFSNTDIIQCMRALRFSYILEEREVIYAGKPDDELSSLDNKHYMSSKGFSIIILNQ